ncbi:MAG TPA: ATP-binding protein [Gemmatimonadales bacterium]|nr:ATP-binding protein [Gemmatimonadales bacterium]
MTGTGGGDRGETAAHLLDILPEPHWILDAAHRVVTANSAAAALVGRAPGDLIGTPLDELVSDEPAKVGRYLRMCARSRQMIPGALGFRGAREVTVECRCDGGLLPSTGDGGSTLVLLRCRSKMQAASRFVALTARIESLNREMAVRRAAERTLRRQAELLEKTHDAIVVWILDTGTITYCNQAAEELFGWPRNEAVGRRIHDLLQTETAAVTAAREQLVRGTGEWTGELVHTTRQGRKITVESRMVRMPGDGEPTLVLETARDVTEARRLRAHVEAAQRLEAVGRLAGGAAHEINNALQAAIGFASFALERMSQDDPVRDDVRETLKAGERAAAITLGLLAFSRRQLLQPSNVSLGAALEEFAPVCRRALGPERELRLELPSSAVIVFADRGQLDQVLLNVVLNARDATSPGGWVRIRLGTATLEAGGLARLGRADLQAGHFACLEVEDSGHGMDQATVARIFEPFYTTKPPGQGTGLGLSVVHGIVNQSGGAISVRSAPGKGSTFTIYLPLSSSQEPNRPEDETAAASGGSERVLVVDDDSMVLQVAARVLEDGGYTVLTASDGADALRRLSDEAARHPGSKGGAPVDAVLTDIVMPVMGGREMEAALTRLYPGLPVLYTSGHPGEEMIGRGLLVEGAPFIQKPFRPEHLLQRLRALLDGSVRARSSGAVMPAGEGKPAQR